MGVFLDDKKSGRLFSATDYHGLTIEEAVAKAETEVKSPYLSNSEVKWLKNRTSDHRPEVRDLAREVYAERFPHAARNQRKQQLSIKVLELTVDDEVCDLYCQAAN